MENDLIEAFANEDNCNLCGHCVAICPADAVIHQRMDMEAFEELKEPQDGEYETLTALLRRRRSHRNFRKEAIPQQVLQTLIGESRYAPRGSNVQNVEILIIQDRDKIKRLSDLSIDYYRNVILQIDENVENLKMEGKEMPPELQWSIRRKRALLRTVKARELGVDSILRGAPTVFVFHSAPYTTSPKENCVIAAHTIVLAATAMGLGTCYIGLLVDSANNSPAIKRELNLPLNNKVMSVLVLGYPKFNFLRVVDRKSIKVRWE
jgi:nitroreductase